MVHVGSCNGISGFNLYEMMKVSRGAEILWRLIRKQFSSDIKCGRLKLCKEPVKTCVYFAAF